MYLILSDLHLGAGDALEDFLLWGDRLEGPAPEQRPEARAQLDTTFARLVDRRIADAARAGLDEPVLLLLGDTFDLWQAQRRRETPERALGRILDAHGDVVAALRRWRSAGGRIEIVIGAHDQPLVHPRAWALLADTLAGINRSSGGRPAHRYVDTCVGILAQHGHQFDAAYRYRGLQNASATCIAREVIRRLVNILEPMVPWIDKAIYLADILRLADAALRPALRSKTFARIARALPDRKLLLKVLAPWARGGCLATDDLARREQRTCCAMTRRLLVQSGHAYPGGAPLRFLVTGHRHVSSRTELPGGIEHLQIGSWKPALITGPDGDRIVQPLPYGLLLPAGDDAWEASVREVQVEDGKEG